MFSTLSKTDIVMQMSSTDAVLPGEIIHIDSYIAGSRSTVVNYSSVRFAGGGFNFHWLSMTPTPSSEHYR